MKKICISDAKTQYFYNDLKVNINTKQLWYKELIILIFKIILDVNNGLNYVNFKVRMDLYTLYVMYLASTSKSWRLQIPLT